MLCINLSNGCSDQEDLDEDEEIDSSCELELLDHLQKMVDNALAQLN